LLSSNLVSNGRCAADFEMRLESNAVDLDFSRLEFFDEVVSGGCLGAGVLEPVVVIVELDVFSGLGNGFLRKLEGEVEVFRADCVEPLSKHINIDS
jgi:hypothetical protein